MKLSVHEVAKAIGIPVERWAGNCFGIADAIVRAGLVEGGTAVYGHWVGDIMPWSYFGDHADRPFTQHGWIVLDDGYETVIDPTRWAFDGKDPYIYEGAHWGLSDLTPCRTCGHIADEHDNSFMGECQACACPSFDPEKWPYDEGGNNLRQATVRPPPEPVEDEREYTLSIGAEALNHVQQLLQDFDGAFTSLQLHWLAALPYDTLGKWVSEIYAAYKEHGYVKAFIPMDNRLRAEREAEKG